MPKGQLSERVLAEHTKAAFDALYYNYKRTARIREYAFTLTKEEFLELTKSDCFYCGTEPKQYKSKYGNKSRKGIPFVYNGIDRVDNSVGYEYANCVPCCKTCNRMKGCLGFNEFTKKIKEIVDNLCLLLR
ncbi:MAG: hypothetical protein IMZ53_02845 [Thermoplasmata archaeon]|nr:hypothetical protein [Thermoplasmata archaeon]